jgi:cytochrome c biogenesis protein CcmG/thiol:disulfide interchange protein DsbE
MPKCSLRYIPFAVFTVIVIVMATQIYRQQEGESKETLESVLIGKALPLPALDTLSQGEKAPSALRGKVWLLNVWATWCPTCYAEHQFLTELAGKGVMIAGLNYKDETDKARRWLKDLSNPYLFTWKDERGLNGIELGVYGAPETFLIDKQGRIRYRLTGAMDEQGWAAMKPLYQKLLEENE